MRWVRRENATHRQRDRDGSGRYDRLRACADSREFRVESGEDVMHCEGYIAGAIDPSSPTVGRLLIRLIADSRSMAHGETTLAVHARSGWDEALDFLVDA